MNVKLATIRARFPDHLLQLLGDADTQILNVSPPGQSTDGSMVFVTDDRLLGQAIAGPAACLVLSAKSNAAIGGLQLTRAVVFSKNVKLAMAVVKQEYFAYEIPLQDVGTIHPSAVIDGSVVIGKNVSIGAYSVVGRNVSVADNVRIDCSVIIEADAKIGKDSHLYSHLYIGPRTEIGERCQVMPHCTIGAEGFGFARDERGNYYRMPQTGKVVIENDVEVGANTTIDRAAFRVTRIGEGTKIDKQAHIAHNCEIGKHCVLAGKFAVAGSAKIGDHFIAGGRVTVKDGITITDGVEIAGLSGVHTSITEPGQYGGFPIQPIRDALRSGMSLAHLPRIRKDLMKVLKHLGLRDE